jgi:hypothetical protein
LDPDDTFHHYLAQEKDAGAKSVLKPFAHDMTNNEILDRTSIFIKKRSKVLPVTLLLLILIIFYLLGIFFRAAEQSSEPLPAPAGTALETPAPATDSPAPSPAAPATPPPAAPPIAQDPLPIKTPPPARQKITIAPSVSADDAPPVGAAAPPLPAAAEKEAAASKPLEPGKTVSLPITVKVATETRPLAAETDFKYVLEARFEEGSRVGIKVDDKPRLQYDSQAGIVRIWQARDSIVLDLDNRTGVSLTLNGKPLPINGTEGGAATINIPADLPEDIQP